MLHLLYLLCVFYLGWKVFRWLFAALGRWFVRKQAEQFYTGMFGQQQPRSGRQNRNNPPTQPQKKKVFSRSEGEYVEFVEIQETETDAEQRKKNINVTYKKEEQVTDAEWQDI